MNSGLLFVYGSLRRGSRVPARRVLDRHGPWLGMATAAGTLYAVADYPGLVPRLRGRGRVVGELYRVRAPRRVWPVLDAWEGCRSTDPPPREYRRRLVRVRRGGRDLRAWAYLYQRPTRHLRRLPRPDWCARPGRR